MDGSKWGTQLFVLHGIKYAGQVWRINDNDNWIVSNFKAQSGLGSKRQDR